MGNAVTEADGRKGFRAGPVLLGLLAFLAIACIASGAFFYIWIVVDYLADASPFVGLQMLGWIFGMFSAGVISAGLLLAGLLFRLMPWRLAPRASLCLAIAAVIFLVITYLVFSDIDKAQEHAELLILQGASVLYPFLIALPPFLHWLRARPLS